MITLWVRSYVALESLQIDIPGEWTFHLQSVRGNVIAFTILDITLLPIKRDLAGMTSPYSNVSLTNLSRSDGFHTAVSGNQYYTSLTSYNTRVCAVPYWGPL